MIAKKPTHEELEQRVHELENGVFERSAVGLLESEAKNRNVVERFLSAIYLAAVDEPGPTLFLTPTLISSINDFKIKWMQYRLEKVK